ncbi:MAG: RNA polymerase sigma factor [Phycisphaerae bacterium]
MNDRELIERCRAGERKAQRQLFEKTSVRIYRLLLRMTGNPDEAFDLTQETYVKGLQRLHQFDGRSAVESWFYRIAVNEALQFRRRQSVGTAKLQVLATNRPTEAQRPRTDLRLDLEGALAELPPDDRALLLLRYQEELDYRGIAEVLGCAEGTVASRLNRARDRLREILRKSYS